MPIHRKTREPPGSQSITERSRALDLFTNRLAERRLFTQYVNEEPPLNKILYFHGDGGTGKSLLLDFLQREYCHNVSPKDWQPLKEIEKDNNFIEAFSRIKPMTRIPSARLDFGVREMGDDRPREDWSGLLMLRRELGPQGLYFPTFDFGVILFLHKTRQLNKAKLINLFPEEESELTAALIDLITGVPFASLATKVIGLFENTFKEKLALHTHKRGLDQALVERLTRMDPQAELRDELPHLLGQDLNTSLQLHEKGEHAPRRVVFFFDTHEAFWGSERLEQSPFSYFQQDEWLRRLIGELYSPNFGAIVVLAGREPPCWSEPNAGELRIDGDCIDIKLIGNLNREDAQGYLNNAGITDSDLRVSLISFAELEHNQVHPLYLGLCADIILEAGKRGERLRADDFAQLPDTEQKGRELINRLLKYCTPNVRATVEALAAVRAFDLPLYLNIGRELHLHVSAPDFQELTKFSFIRGEVGPNANLYTIHNLLRKLLNQIAPTKIQEAHKALENYYQNKAETDIFATVEHIYHINQQDWERGYRQWAKNFENAMGQAQYALCEALVSLTPDLIIKKSFECGVIANDSASLFTRLSRHKAGEQAFKEAILYFEQTLELSPTNRAALNNKGNALQHLGTLLTVLSRHEEAEAFFRDAIATFDRSLEVETDDVCLLNKGTAFNRLGNLLASLSRHGDAETSFNDAISTFGQLLVLVPENVAALKNKGSVFIGLADLQASLSRYQDAESSYRHAIHAYACASELASDDVLAMTNKGVAFQGMGDLLVILSRFDEAETSFRHAIVAHDKALLVAPEFISSYINKGISLKSMGNLATLLARYEDAETFYREGIGAYECCLALAPEDVKALNNLGIAFQRLGNLLMNQNQYAGAEKSFRDAIATFDRTLTIAPMYVAAQNSKGNVSIFLGDLETAISQYEAAEISFRIAITTYDNALTTAPNNVAAHIGKGVALLKLWSLMTALGHQETAERLHQDAIISLDHALAFAPKSLAAIKTKGNAFIKLGSFHLQIGKRDIARFNLEQAINSLDNALALAPNDREAIQARQKVQEIWEESFGNIAT